MDITFTDLKKYGLYKESCGTIIMNILHDSIPNSTINIFLPEENHLSNGDISEKIFKILKKRNIKINFIFGGFEKYKETEKYDSPENNIHLHLWPTAGIFLNVKEILKHYSVPQLRIKQEKDFEFPFVSLSHRAKFHRCYLIDNLVKENLLNKGCYTWYNASGGDGPLYNWKYTDPKLIKRALGNDINNLTNVTYMPRDYFKSFIHLVSEGLDDGHFITEKTVIPIIHKKPFIVQGIKGFHKLLKEKLQFELYEEIFDYTFDEIDCWETRTNLIIENLKNTINANHNELYEKIYPKLEYNQNRMFEIINQKIEVPDIVLNSKTMDNIFKFSKPIV